VKLTLTHDGCDWETRTYKDVGGRTLLTLHQTVDESLAKRTGAHPSWLSMFDRLAADLARVR
jgi:hypothetical protein